MDYKFCILCAGKGTRSRIVRGIHKSLLPLENRPVISHILDRIPKDVEVIVAVGCLSEQVKSYLNLVHHDRKITFVEIENYDGKGSGPGRSLFCCQEHLQCPFVFTSVDTIVREDLNMNYTHNWMGVSNIDGNINTKYCLIDGETQMEGFHYGTSGNAFIGMSGIYDYSVFWKNLENGSLINGEHQVLNGFEGMSIELRKFVWFDTGDDISYENTKKEFRNDLVATKNDEVLFRDNGFVVKYFFDSKRVEDRVQRASYLGDLCPKVERLNANMYFYEYIHGMTVADVCDEEVLTRLIPFWYEEVGSIQFEKNTKFTEDCEYMYHHKTRERCMSFVSDDLDTVSLVNGVKVEPVMTMLDNVDWKSVSNHTIPSKFHGDFQPENILYDGRRFWLIDWRESFGDSLVIGDLYYDLGKLNHALLINGQDVNHRLYRVEVNGHVAMISYYTRSNLTFLQNELRKFCDRNGYSWEHIELLTALQYLGISSLYKNFHDGEYGKFLFLYGKMVLAKLFNQQKERSYERSDRPV